MQWTSLNDLREKYLSFFESKGHLRLPSFSLIPSGDKSLLLINSGMAPMKKFFTGEVTPPRTRVTTCQKCIRTPDIERVGHTARHGTYFEMLGNFSFGDYFKREAIHWSWEFFTKVLEMPADKIYCSVYEKDDEAWDIWTKEVGVAEDHMKRLGKEDNFWEHGSGPCGPCSEIYFDRGEKYGCGKPDCGVGCDCDRYVEVWNNVFSQFNNDGKGNYTELKQKNIDTGMGLERLACVMQGVDNLFEVDTVQNIMKHISRIAGVEYKVDEKTDISLRVITDHIRSTTFMIGDGVMPSNNGRGYVLRRLLRRAARHGRLLGIERPFLSEVVDTVIGENETAYPELKEKRDLIKKVVAVEEESFARTVGQGMQILDAFVAANPGGTLSAEETFKLQDTYGFPVDLTVEILADRGVGVDVEGFRALYEQYRKDTRAARKNAGADAWKGERDRLSGLPATAFVGYEALTAEAKVVALLADGESVDSIGEGQEAVVVLDTTPCYAESGGQVGDTGFIRAASGTFRVSDTRKTPEGVFCHVGAVTQGVLSVGDSVTAAVDEDRRLAIMRNHTAAHLLQAALRRVLGTHVEQAGQLVSAESVRFDFTHFSALTADELKAVESAVNAAILSALPVTVTEMPVDEARKMGAMALFGEKYGDTVRVVDAKDFSLELCGGTHVSNTARIGLFRILSEGSVAAGVRRIEGVTGTGVLALLEKESEVLSRAMAAVKAGKAEDLPERIAALQEDNKRKDAALDALNAGIAASRLDALMASAVDVGGVKLAAAPFWGESADALRAACDQARDGHPDAVLVLGFASGEKVTFAAACGKNAQAKGAHAGNLVREIAKLAGGSGGGRPDSAMAGGKEPAKLNDALAAAESILAAQLNQ
ncbi:MAG: alanine--tRNA ligase [Clostridia bacterium]|nr:alanine--tRNA ligase [Clostridia bacterium]